MAGQLTVSGQVGLLSGQTFIWPVILTGQVHGSQINNWKNKFIHINSVNYRKHLNQYIFFENIAV